MKYLICLFLTVGCVDWNTSIPKFKKGDCIENKKLYKIIDIGQYSYNLSSLDGNTYTLAFINENSVHQIDCFGDLKDLK